MAQYKTCPYCGAHLDHGEICDCKKSENASAATETPSEKGSYAEPSLSANLPNVNDCFHLREICESTGAMGKDIALVVRDIFPSFNRQLLAQCQSNDKYGIIIHPAGLDIICKTYGVQLQPPSMGSTQDAPNPIISKEKKPENRRLPRRLTLRMTTSDYCKLLELVDKDGYSSVQAWLYEKVHELLGGAK